MQKILWCTVRKKRLSFSTRWFFMLLIVAFLYVVINLNFSLSKNIFIQQATSKILIEKEQSLFIQHVSTPPAEETLNYSRCKARRIGCFMTITGYALLAKQTPLTSANSSLQECWLKCYRKKFHYVAYAAIHRCFCGKFITEFYVLTQGLLLKDNSSECLSKRHTDVYMIERCTANVEDDLPQQVIGCHSKVLLETKGWITASRNKSPTSCFLTCEDRGFLLASHSHMKECYCFNPTPNIGYPDRATTVEASWCDRGSEDHMLVMRTYVEDQRCSSKQFLANRTPLTGLVSFPGSGNSWTRHLIELASGYYTGSLYHDNDMYTQGQLGEILDWRSRRTIVIKSHKPDLEHAGLYDRAILLIRNPYDAILAEYNRLHGGKTGFATSLSFQSEEWDRFVPYKIDKWTQTVDAYVTSSVPILVVYFEDLVTDTISVVRTMLKFIDVKVEDLEQRLVCVQGDISGNFHRENVKLNPYSTSMIEIVNERIKTVREILLKNEDRGFKPFPSYERNITSL